MTHPILLVEDSSEDAFLLSYAFKRAEIKNPIYVVTDGQMAIDYLSGAGQFADRKQFPVPGIVLLDLKLPQRMGLEVLAWIRQQVSLKWLIIIVLSSSIHDQDIERAYELGVNAFLVKPSDVDVLADMCKALKQFWLIYNRPPIQLPAER